MQTVVASVAACLLSLGMSDQVHADYFAAYGSLTYAASSGSGYQFQSQQILPGMPVNDSGTAIGYAEKDNVNNSQGERAVRWDSAAGSATELGNLGTDSSGATSSGAYAVNAAGTAVGYAEKYDANNNLFGERAVRWDSTTGAATELGNLGTDSAGATSNEAYAINAAGTAVGYAFKFGASNMFLGQRAVRWDGVTGASTELGNLGTDLSGATNSAAYAINATGMTVGYANKYGASNQYLGERAVRWDSTTGTATDLSNLGTDPSSATYSAAYAINAAGTAVGYANKYGATNQYLGERAVRWDGTTSKATELGNLGTDSSGATSSEALAINAAGTAVGYARKYDSNSQDMGRRAVRWDSTLGAATELGNLGTTTGGSTNSEAYAVNAADAAVGYAEKYLANHQDMGERAVYWKQDGAAIDLNALIDPESGWTLKQAYGFSDTGWITGLGAFSAGSQPAYARLFLIHSPSYTWTGGTDTHWSTAGNWQGNVVPVSNVYTTITFAGSAHLDAAQEIASRFQLNALVFDNTAGIFSLTGGTLDFHQSDIGAPATISQNSPSLVTIDNDLLFSDKVSYNGDGSMIINGNITGGKDFLKTGSGTLTLSGSNSDLGGMTVTGGTLILTNSEALPDGGSLTIGTDASALFGASAAFGAGASATVVPVPEPGTTELFTVAACGVALCHSMRSWRTPRNASVRNAASLGRGP